MTTTDPISFAEHIKPLFRQKDRDAMLSSFDLWECKDVADNATAILAEIKAGSMPCDQTWPAPQIELLQRWIDAGAPP
jgi:hypothetical protein